MAAKGRHLRARTHRTWWQRTLIGFGCVTVLCCVAGATAVLYVYGKFDQIVRYSAEEVPVEEVPRTEPQNYLIVGSDSRENVDTSNDPEAPPGQRSDTIILARLDPDDDRISMLSFPRDLWLPIAGTNSHNRINSAYGRGRDVLINTITQNFGIEINHYVEVDFVGFERMIDAIGGVPVYFDTTYRDLASGLAPVGPGCAVLDGEQALGFARGRELQYRDDGSWRTDPTGDLGRISRQQFLVRRALDEVLALELLDVTNVGTFNRLLNVAVSSVGVDAGLSIDDMRALADRFRDFDTERIVTYSLPVTAFRTSGGASVLDLDERGARSALNVFRGVEPGTIDVVDVDVLVQNGSGLSRQAADATAALEAVGFYAAIDEPGDTGEPFERTTVYYGPGSEHAAQLLARHLTSQAAFEYEPGLALNQLRLVTGMDFTTVVRRPWAADAVAVPVVPAAPSTTDPDGSTTTAPETTTTTVIGVVPEPPPGQEC